MTNNENPEASAPDSNEVAEDVEGHKRFNNLVDEDDVEGHKRFNSLVDEDDVEGHRTVLK